MKRMIVRFESFDCQLYKILHNSFIVAKSQIPNFFQENPFDNRVSRRVKRAYSSVDSVGIRLGVFLRRYPLARNLGIGYIFLLNFWVLLVLFTSTPGG